MKLLFIILLFNSFLFSLSHVTETHSNGMPAIVETYSNYGMLRLKKIVSYYDNGMISQEQIFDNNHNNKEHISFNYLSNTGYYRNGNLKFQAKYRNGNPKFNRWHSNGEKFGYEIDGLWIELRDLNRILIEERNIHIEFMLIASTNLRNFTILLDDYDNAKRETAEHIDISIISNTQFKMGRTYNEQEYSNIFHFIDDKIIDANYGQKYIKIDKIPESAQELIEFAFLNEQKIKQFMNEK